MSVTAGLVCESCGTPGGPNMRFCGSCGRRLSKTCPACNSANPGTFKFCGSCATRLDQDRSGEFERPSAPPSERTPVSLRPEGERRQLTVSFVDIVGSVSLAESMDAEDLRDLVRDYQAVVVHAVEANGGHIAQYLGDGVLAYFGYPTAREDDAIRAIRAAVRTVSGVKELNKRNPSSPLRVRVGLDTGVGVIGDMGAGTHYERLVIGNTPNVAARVQSAASPGEVLVSSETRKLAEEAFEFGEERMVEFKGLSAPMGVSTVLTERRRTHGITSNRKFAAKPFVGRFTELETLRKHLSAAQGGRGSTVLVTGDAGLGKSRLVFAFATSLPEEVRALSARCAPDAENTPLLPVAELLRQLLGLENAAADADRLRVFAERRSSPHSAELLGDLLGVPIVNEPAGAPLSPVRKRELTLRLVSDVLIDAAKERPLVVLVEDLHWIDPSSLEVIDNLMEAGAKAPIMLLLTGRPTFATPWGFRPYLTKVELKRLTPEEAEEVMQTVTGNKPLPSAIAKDLLSRADGVPLYIEEMTKAVVESSLLREGSRGFELNLPSTLRDSLAARLDNLGPAKDIAQLASVIGRIFSFDLLVALSPLDLPILRRQVDQLLSAELIEVNETSSEESYIFRHALVRDAAYDSLLRRKREELHGRVADQMQAKRDRSIVDRPELLALHLEHAGRTQLAVDAWFEAGKKALGRSANHEAIAHCKRALGLLSKLAPDAASRALELQIQLHLGPAYIATAGWASEGVRTAFGRARQLCEAVGESEATFPALWGVWSYEFVAGHFPKSVRLSEQLAAIAQNSTDPRILLPTAHACAFDSFFTTNYAAAEAWGRRMLPHYTIEAERDITQTLQQSSTCAVLNSLSMSLWVQGYPDQAREVALRAMPIARELGHAHTIAWVAASVLWGVGMFLRDDTWLAESVEDTIKYSDEIGNAFFPPLARLYHAWMQVRSGDHDAIGDVRKYFTSWQASGAGILVSGNFSLLLESYLLCGKVEEGLDAGKEAHAHIERSNERHLQGEICRLEAELLAKRGSSDDLLRAGQKVERALELAKSSGARSLELRAHASRLRICSGTEGEALARAELEKCYAEFSEGFETHDLRAARRLLDESDSASRVTEPR